MRVRAAGAHQPLLPPSCWPTARTCSAMSACAAKHTAAGAAPGAGLWRGSHVLQVEVADGVSGGGVQGGRARLGGDRAAQQVKTGITHGDGEGGECGAYFEVWPWAPMLGRRWAGGRTAAAGADDATASFWLACCTAALTLREGRGTGWEVSGGRSGMSMMSNTKLSVLLDTGCVCCSSSCCCCCCFCGCCCCCGSDTLASTDTCFCKEAK